MNANGNRPGKEMGTALLGAGIILIGMRQKRMVPRYLLALIGGNLVRRGVRRYSLVRHATQKEQQSVDLASEQSFPASDPPGWIGG